MAIKLIKACKELNIGMSTAVEYLSSLGKEVSAGPFTRIDDDMYLELAKKFNEDVASRLTADAASDVSSCSSKSNTLNLQNFDWEAYEAQHENTSIADTIAKFDSALTSLEEHDVVKGTVSSINRRQVFINVGYKEGFVPTSEFFYNPDLKVGDFVEVCIIKEDPSGYLVLSHKEARAIKSWELVTTAFEKKNTVKGFVKFRTKGGLIVDTLGTEAFLPGSQLSVKPIRDLDIFIGKTLDLKITKLNKEFRNVVVSHRVLEEEELERQRDIVTNSIDKGTIIEGTVQHFEEYGAFIEFSGIKGLLHISEMSWNKTIKPENVLSLGQKINLIVVDKDNQGRISLSLKKLLPNPWESPDLNVKVGDIVSGQITEIDEKFALAQLSSGIAGIIPLSEMSWEQRLRKTNDYVKKGDTVQLKVIDFNLESTKLVLSIKQTYSNPWLEVDSKYAKGSIHKCKVINVKEDIGAFVELEPGVIGLVSKSEFGWQNEYTPSVNDEREARVIGIKEEKIYLSFKAASENPLKLLADSLVDPVYVTVLGFDQDKKIVKVDYDGHESFISRDNLSINKVIKMEDEVFIGERLLVKCIGYENKSLEFSLREFDEDIYDASYYDKSLLELLAEMGIHTNKFVAKANRCGESQIMLTNLSVVDEDNDDRGRLLADPVTGNNKVIVVTEKKAENYTPGSYYIVTLGLAPREYRLRKHDPFIFAIHSKVSSIENPYRESVELAYTKHTSPDTNQSVARLLDEVGENLYSSKKRMFFELLQNADDSSAINGVRFNVETTNEYLIITHNGFSFNLEDFESIISAAKSTKRANQKKTGYKGIGFKSVFTGTQKVLIKTGGLFFSFDSQNPEYNDFEKFYFKVNGLKTEEDKQIFLKKFRTTKSTFRGYHDIPWQLLPIWEDQIPNELLSTSFRDSKTNVAIAIKKSEIDIKESYDSISDVLKEPLFLLFLRNTKRVQLSLNGSVHTVQKVTLKDSAEIVSSVNPHLKRRFSVKNIYDIPVSDEDFEKCNIPIRKSQELVPGQDEKEDIFEQFESGSFKKIDVPSRIASSNQTTISYAISLDKNGQVNPIIDRGNSLFAYLPMNEMSYRFPFYINADFIPTSDREGVQTNNPWNWYLFYQIGRRFPEWVANYASKDNPEYLNLLQDHLFIEDTLSCHFNRGYKESIAETPFILAEDGHVAKQDEIIIDKSGLSSIIGSTLFRQILNTDRQLPFGGINVDILEKSKIKENDRDVSTRLFGEIEIVKAKDIYPFLENNPLLNSWLKSADKESRLSFFSWILDHENVCEGIVASLPIFKCGAEILSLDELKDKSDYLLMVDNVAPLNGLLTKLGFTCTEEITNEHPLYGLIDIPTEKSVFDVVLKKAPFTDLTTKEKVELVLGLYKLTGVGMVQIQSMSIFHNKKGELLPMNLLVRTDKEYLENFSISEDEYSEELDDFLLSESDVYAEILCTSNNTKVFTQENISVIYNDYKDYWTTPFWKNLVSTMSSEALLSIISNASSEIIVEFLKKVSTIHLDQETYNEKDFEYQVYALANNIQRNDLLLEKTYIGEDLVSNYSIKDDVTIEIDRRPYLMSLSEILPSRKTHVMALFKQRLPFVNIELIELDHSKIAREIFDEITSTEKPITPAQFVYICVWNKSRNVTNYAPCHEEQVLSMNQHAVECLEYCYTHKLALNIFQFRKTGAVNWNIYDKYFDIPNLLLDDERIPKDIQLWADTEDKQNFLKVLGANSIDETRIKVRNAFWLGEEYNDAITVDVNTFRWMASVANEKLTEGDDLRSNRIKLLERMLAQTRQNYKRRTMELCRAEAQEWEGGKIYSDWKNERGRRIFICPQGVPYQIVYGEYTYCTLHDDLYFEYNGDYFISGAIDIQEAMNRAIDSRFTREDWHRLFSVSSKEYQSLQDKYDQLLAEFELFKSSYSGSNRDAHFGAGEDSDLSELQKKEAQREAQEYLKYLKPDWQFPAGYGEFDADDNLRCFSTEQITDADGNDMWIVLKSYKKRSEPFKINPKEWDYIAKQDAHLFIYTGSDIVEISKEDIIRNQTNISITFSTNNLEIEDRIQQFSDIIHYFKGIHFDFASFNITEKAQSIRNMYNKHEGSQMSTSDDDL